MYYTTYSRVTSSQANQEDDEWSTIVEKHFTKHVVVGKPELMTDADFKKNAAPGFSPVKLIDGANTRASANVECVTMMVADIDDATYDQLRKLKAWAKQFECVFYSTLSHRSMQTPKFRLVFPLETPVSQERFPVVWQHFKQALLEVAGARIDKACKDSCRYYILPVLHSDSKQDDHFCEHYTGPFLTAEKLLEFKVEGLVRSEPTFEDRHNVANKTTLKKRIASLSKKDPNNRHYEHLVALHKGDAIEDDDGNRRAAWLPLTGYIISTIYRDCTNESVKKVCYDSIIASAELKPDQGVTEFIEEIYAIIDSQFEKVDAGEWTTERHERIKSTMQRRLKVDPLDQKGLEARADMADMSVEQYLKTYILQDGEAYFVRTPNDSYTTKSLRRSELPSVIRDIVMPRLIDVAPHKVDSFMQDDRRMRSTDEILAEFSSVVSHVEYDWNYTGTALVEQEDGQLPFLRVGLMGTPQVPPKYHEHVAKWLALFCGDELENVKKWIAQASMLNRPLKALMFHGPRRTGKTLFAKAISQALGFDDCLLAAQWHDGKADYKQSPILLAEEGLPRPWKGSEGMKALKSFLTAQSHQRRQLYENFSTVRGFYRLIVTANDLDAFYAGEHVPVQSQRAFSERFLFVDTPMAAHKFLSGFSADEQQRMYDCEIAEHFHWLRENLPIEYSTRTSRMGFESDESRITDLLQTTDARMSYLLDWFISLIMDPGMLTEDPDHNCKLFCDESGDIWVDPALFTKQDVFSLYHDQVRNWTENLAQKYLHDLSDNVVITAPRPHNEKLNRRYYCVSLDKIVRLMHGSYDLEYLQYKTLSEGGLREKLMRAHAPVKDIKLNAPS